MALVFNYSSSSSQSDEESQIQPVPIRQFEHEQGQWAIHVFVPLSAVLTNELLDNSLSIDDGKIYRLDHKCLHISLSRCFPTRRHFIEPIFNDLRQVLEQKQSRNLLVCVNSTHLTVLANDSNTRFFLGIVVKDNQSVEILESLVQKVDQVLAQYRAPLYYKDRCFHISLAWADERQRLERIALSKAGAKGKTFMIPIENLVLKYGGQFVKTFKL
ncbi:hypothetical protein ACOME3_004133 [Neoechinorhynchus agilis]